MLSEADSPTAWSMVIEDTWKKDYHLTPVPI